MTTPNAPSVRGKIPTLFRRDPADRRRVLPEVTPGCEWVLAGEGVATRKYDGTCVLLRRDGMAVHAFARREVKAGVRPPPRFEDVHYDDVTGKRLGWEPAEQSPFGRYIAGALLEEPEVAWLPGTYELVGPKVNGNPERLEEHRLVRHADAPRVKCFSLSYRGIRDTVLLLADQEGYEGLVWHHPDGRMAKLKARDVR